MSLVEEFLEKFDATPGPVDKKAKDAYLTKTSIYYLKRGGEPGKRMRAIMQAYLSNEVPLSRRIPEGHFYCGLCEQVKPEAQRARSRKCRDCMNAFGRASFKGYAERVSLYQRRKREWLVRNYGRFADCMALVMELTREVRRAKATRF